MRAATVKTAIWSEDRVFLVEDIPAQVCDSCLEQFYDEETTDALRRLTEEGFASVEPKREILVPIFSLEGRIRRSTSSPQEICADY
jgi:YgiT-type zinc finger domain-containing protein